MREKKIKKIQNNFIEGKIFIKFLSTRSRKKPLLREQSVL